MRVGRSEGGLLLDSRPVIQRGGDSGQAIEAGRPAEGLLVEAIKYESLEMPPVKQLDSATIRLFEESSDGSARPSSTGDHGLNEL